MLTKLKKTARFSKKIVVVVFYIVELIITTFAARNR